MAFSAWKIWLHPKFTARTLDNLETDLASVSDERDRLKEESLQLTDTIAGLRGDKSDLSVALEKTRLDLAAARDEINSLQETEAHLREFEQTLSAVEQLKANYENRIAILRNTIKALKSTSNRLKSDDDLIEDIDMLSSPSSLSSSRTNLSNNISSEEEDWLKSLP